MFDLALAESIARKAAERIFERVNDTYPRTLNKDVLVDEILKALREQDTAPRPTVYPDPVMPFPPRPTPTTNKPWPWRLPDAPTTTGDRLEWAEPYIGDPLPNPVQHIWHGPIVWSGATQSFVPAPVETASITVAAGGGGDDGGNRFVNFVPGSSLCGND